MFNDNYQRLMGRYYRVDLVALCVLYFRGHRPIGKYGHGSIIRVMLPWARELPNGMQLRAWADYKIAAALHYR